MEAYFAAIIENVRHERIFLLSSLVEPDILKQRKITDQEIDISKNIALEKLHRRILKESIALDLLEKQINDLI